MFPCIRCTKLKVDERNDEGEGHEGSTAKTKEAAKSLTTKLKGIALRISGSHKQCKRSTGSSSCRKGHRDQSGAGSVQDVGGATSSSTPAAASASNVQQNESQDQWIAEVEEGIHITFVSLPTGGNVLKRIRFSREKFDRDLAQRWWIENYDRIKELYNVQRFNLNTPGTSEDEQGEGSHSKLTFALGGSLESNRDLTHHYPSRSRRLHVTGHHIHAWSSPSSSMEAEWVEQDEPGVFITIRQLADGTRELRRLRFSRRKQFGAEDAKRWWLENKDRVEAQYL